MNEDILIITFTCRQPSLVVATSSNVTIANIIHKPPSALHIVKPRSLIKYMSADAHADTSLLRAHRALITNATLLL